MARELAPAKKWWDTVVVSLSSPVEVNEVEMSPSPASGLMLAEEFTKEAPAIEA